MSDRRYGSSGHHGSGRREDRGDINRWEDNRNENRQENNRWEASGQKGNSVVIRVKSAVVSNLTARGGAKVNEIQNQTGANITVLNDDDWSTTGVQITGNSEQQKQAERIILEFVNSCSSTAKVEVFAAPASYTADEWDTKTAPQGYQKSHWESERPQSRPYDPERRQNFEPRRNQPQSNGLVIKVPSSSVGRIIGKGGSKINELQEQSGARIRINKVDDDGVEASIQLIGDPEKQKEAERLIRELLDDNPYPTPRQNQPKDNFASEKIEMAFVDWGAVIKESAEATKRRWAQAPQISKSFYVEDQEVALMPREEVEKFRMSRNNIMVSHYKEGDERPIPNPVTGFAQAFNHYPELLEAVQKQGFAEPSPVQCQAWPVLLKGHDMIGIAQTGTGKTLAFLLPAFVHIEGQPIPRSQREGPTVIIMAPTRELAQQIEREVAKFPYKGIKCLCVYGGGDRRQQINASKGVEIIVATPGRLYDLMQSDVLKTSSVSYVVLDEADRMLDLGFEPQIKKILIDVRPDRQMIMTSATWPEGVRRIANDYMDNPIQVCVGTLDLAAVHSITQHVEILAEEDKRARLMDFIHSLEPTDKAIVFVGRKLVADQLASDVSLKGISCQCIHGDREQADREQALADLRDGEVNLLIATDVASRGIDIKDITHILNYDFPRHAEEYVHRVGRTGRAGRSGIAISFMTRDDWSKAQDLINILQEAGQEVPDELVNMAERFAAWKVRKDEERARNATDMGGGGFRGGGRGGGRRGDRDGGGFGFGGPRRGGRDFF